MSSKTVNKEETKQKIKKPSRYKVIMFNDDFTPMDFVVYILINIFKKNETEAYDIMMKVHKEQSAVVGLYSYDIAKTKTNEAMKLAKDEGYPFKIVVEKE